MLLCSDESITGSTTRDTCRPRLFPFSCFCFVLFRSSLKAQCSSSWFVKRACSILPYPFASQPCPFIRFNREWERNVSGWGGERERDFRVSHEARGLVFKTRVVVFRFGASSAVPRASHISFCCCYFSYRVSCCLPAYCVSRFWKRPGLSSPSESQYDSL